MLKSKSLIAVFGSFLLKLDQAFCWKGWLGPTLILLVATTVSSPMVLHRPYCGDDYQFHLVSWLDVQQGWRQGIPYPHWTPSANYGAGEPRFVFYPPLTWMLGAALGLVLPWSLVPAVLTFLLLSATGFATFALARQLLPDAASTLAACAALFSGYALFSAYERAAFAELSGGFWIPLLLLFALRDRNTFAPFWRRVLDGSTVPLALLLAGSWLSDVPVGVMASYTLAAIALTAALLARSLVPVVRAAIAAALGIGLSALYLVPAAWEQRWVDIRQATGIAGDAGLLIENNWLFAPSSNPPLRPHSVGQPVVLILSVSMIAVTLGSLFALWVRGKLRVEGGTETPSLPEATQAAACHELVGLQFSQDLNRTESAVRLASGICPSGAPLGNRPESSVPLAYRWWVPLALIPLAVLYLQLPASLPVWNLLPKLRFLQFPWRWLLVLEAPMAIFFAAAIWLGKPVRRWQRGAASAICALFFLTSTVFALKTFFRVCHQEDSLPRLLTRYHSGAGFWGADEYAPPDADNSMVATGLPDACQVSVATTELGIAGAPASNPEWQPVQGRCGAIAIATLRQPEHMRIVTVNKHAGYLILRLRSYPAWRVTLNGRLVTNLPRRADGLMAVPVPQGSVDMKVDWTTTEDVIIGRWLSVLSLLLLTSLYFLERELRTLTE